MATACAPCLKAISLAPIHLFTKQIVPSLCQESFACVNPRRFFKFSFLLVQYLSHFSAKLVSALNSPMYALPVILLSA